MATFALDYTIPCFFAHNKLVCTLAEKRQHVFLATKFAIVTHPDGTYTTDTSPEYAKKALAKSLERLGLPSVDLYYIHRLDQVTPIEKTMEALVELKNEGKFKYIGISECSSATVRRAHAIHPISAVQSEYSPFSLEIESKQIDLLRTCRELGVATVAYSPLGRGLISGQYKSPDDFEDGDIRKWLPRFTKENFPKNLELVNQLNKIATRKSITTSQLALAWLLAQGDDIFPIPGTQRLNRLEENIGAASVQLSKEEEQEIRKAVEAAEVGGSRYPDAITSSLYADTPAL
jgi:aryl-alcohol dehydrogenase-like predicted oxidoreductase